MSTSGSAFAMDNKNDPCRICNDSLTSGFHFGTSCCIACAAFFRRTVKNQFTCNANNDCVISFEKKFTCRACRYNNCLKAGMRKDYIRKINSNYVPKQKCVNVDASRSIGTSSASSSSSESSPLVSPIIEKPIGKYSKILKRYPQELLQFYVKEVEKTIANRRKNSSKNILHAKSMNELMVITAHQSGSAMEACINCPGVSKLHQKDIRVLHKYFQFLNVWLDSVREYSMSDGAHYEIGVDRKLSEFIHQVRTTLGSSLANLKLNMYEYSAFKLFCIWNLKFHKTSTALKIVAQEHYEGVCSALRNYYETQTKMDDFEIAIRIGDITLQIVTVSDIYHDFIKLLLNSGISI